MPVSPGQRQARKVPSVPSVVSWWELPLVLRLTEAARVARRSQATLQTEIRAGRLRAKKAGEGTQRDHFTILREDLMSWLGVDSHGGSKPSHDAPAAAAGDRPRGGRVTEVMA